MWREHKLNCVLVTEASIPTHVFSLSEDAIESSHESDREALLEHNRHFLMRVYPSGMRVTSSNYDPLFAWQQGAQMVALNWQQSDKGMMLNDGMFANGPGWVLKPEFYRSRGKNSRKGVVSSLDLAIEVFAGHQIPLPLDSSSSLNADDFRPYVTCRLHLCHVDPDTGAAADYRKASKSKARTKSRKGVDPDFEGEKLEFATANNVLEELSFLRLVLSHSWRQNCKGPTQPIPIHATARVCRTTHCPCVVATQLRSRSCVVWSHNVTLIHIRSQAQNQKRRVWTRSIHSVGLHPTGSPQRRVSVAASERYSWSPVERSFVGESHKAGILNGKGGELSGFRSIDVLNICDDVSSVDGYNVGNMWLVPRSTIRNFACRIPYYISLFSCYTTLLPSVHLCDPLFGYSICRRTCPRRLPFSISTGAAGSG